MKPYGEEAGRRIRRHRALRAGKGFETLERYTDLEGLCREKPELAGQTVLVECLSNLTANEMFEPEGAGLAGGEEAIVSGIHCLSELAETLIVVTADVFGEGRQTGSAADGQVAGADLTDLYVRILGNVNARLAQMADEVVEVVYSIPVKQKG
jgi:adenosylcobinamide kinase/adenosylcobinamide-phosphate guanylyltransferase